MIRILAAGDEELLERFLLRHADSSMFLRSNARHAGLADRGEPLQATYAAAVEGSELAAVAAHCWNGMLLLQAPVNTAQLARAAVQATGRRLQGIAGPWQQVLEAAAAFGIAPRRDREVLYALELADLRFTIAPGLAGRRPRADELEVCTDWREAYLIETRLARAGPQLRGIARSGIALSHVQQNDWVVERGGRLVGYTAFNARLPDMVQVGGVWTPVELRSQGIARAAVGSHLTDARSKGIRRAVLFTPETNTPARRAYESLGFRVAGDYGLVVP